MKKSFVLHKDSLNVLDDLTDEQAGKLFKAIKAYQCGEEVELDAITKIAFSPFRNQFDRDNKRWEKTCEARAEAGRKGGKAKVANASKSQQDLANLADSDSDSDSESESETKDLIVQPEPARKKFKYEEKDLEVAKWMFTRVQIIDQTAKEPNYENWANTVRLMREIDNRTHQEIGKTFLWANKDSFWCTNILSPTKLRKQWTALQAKMVNQNETVQSGRHDASHSGESAAMQRFRAEQAKRSASREGNSTGGAVLDHDDGSVFGQVEQEERRLSIGHLDSGDWEPVER